MDFILLFYYISLIYLILMSMWILDDLNFLYLFYVCVLGGGPRGAASY